MKKKNKYSLNQCYVSFPNKPVRPEMFSCWVGLELLSQRPREQNVTAAQQMSELGSYKEWRGSRENLLTGLKDVKTFSSTSSSVFFPQDEM